MSRYLRPHWPSRRKRNTTQRCAGSAQGVMPPSRKSDAPGPSAPIRSAARAQDEALRPGQKNRAPLSARSALWVLQSAIDTSTAAVDLGQPTICARQQRAQAQTWVATEPRSQGPSCGFGKPSIAVSDAGTTPDAAATHGHDHGLKLELRGRRGRGGLILCTHAAVSFRQASRRATGGRLRQNRDDGRRPRARFLAGDAVWQRPRRP
jgi:hypothetical protein